MVNPRCFLLAAALVGTGAGAQSQARPWVPPEYPPTISDRFPPTLPHSGVAVVRGSGEVLNSDPVIARPSTMVIQGRWLWMNDESGDPFIHAIDLRSGRVVRSLGRAGEGPGDFRQVMQLTLRPGDTTGVWAYDVSQRRLTRLSRTAQNSHTIIRSQHTGPTLRMVWLAADRLLIVGSADTARIVLADGTGRVREVRSGAVLGRSEVPVQTRIGASEGVQVCPSPSGDRFGVGYSNAARVELYASTGVLLGLMRGPSWGLELGDFVRNREGVWGLPRVRYYYRGCSATSRFYYGLFAGRTDAAGPEGTKRWDAPFVHIFDWTGALRLVLELDQYAEGIAVDGDSVLYAGGGAMEGIYRYRLPAELGSTARP